MSATPSPAHPGAPGQPAPAAPEAPPHEPAPVDIAEESIAGEEDPGASLDLAVGSPTPSPTLVVTGPGAAPASDGRERSA